MSCQPYVNVGIPRPQESWRRADKEGVEVSHVFWYGGPDRNPFQGIGNTQTGCAPIMRCRAPNGRMSLPCGPNLSFRTHASINLRLPEPRTQLQLLGSIAIA